MIRKAKNALDPIVVPAANNWGTSDVDEVNRRRLRARDTNFRIKNCQPAHPIYSTFEISSPSGMTYRAEIRDLKTRQFSCQCVDFRINGLGTCKHVEALLGHLEKRHRSLFRLAAQEGSNRIDLTPDPAAGCLRVSRLAELPKDTRKLFNSDGCSILPPEEVLDRLAKIDLPQFRISQDVEPWLEQRRFLRDRQETRHLYELKVQSGEWPPQETLVPLFPYQREGMLHLAFTERALLADEMGLGKTIQAIAACSLLRRLGKASRVLIVTPASLKTEWEDQIQKFTALPYKVVYGSRPIRLHVYQARDAFFLICNYEQIVRDVAAVNQLWQPDVVVLDEAQRIKNWDTLTAQAIKRLKSRYAFVLTGTPIENRIDELHSLMDFLNPAVLGPLFRFNRDFYLLDENGRPAGYQNLDQLHARIKPYMLRRLKADVETELPPRVDRFHFVPMTAEQKNRYIDHEAQVARLISIAKRRPLTQQEQEKLLRELAMMRMVCDTNFILDPKDKACPKLAELEKILEETRENPGQKVIIFSEWERMLVLVRELCERMKLGYAWHTGSVPQLRRRAEIQCFKNDPNCRVFLSTDSGSTGLNLQSANVVVNCDLPWNPAKLEQRIARAWRKHQSQPVTVLNLVSENTIEHRMIETLGHKQALADHVLDLKDSGKALEFRSGRQSFLKRLEQLMKGSGTNKDSAAPETNQSDPKQPSKVLPVDKPLGFSQAAAQCLGANLVRCEELYPAQGSHTLLLVVVGRDPLLWQEKLRPLHQEFFGPGLSDPLAPTHLEVIDQATWEALDRLKKAGLLQETSRGARPLNPEAAVNPPALSEEELRKISDLKAQAARKLKAGRMLAEADLLEEARPAFLNGLLSLAQARALENRLALPTAVTDLADPPFHRLWNGQAAEVARYVGGDNAAWPALVDLI